MTVSSTNTKNSYSGNGSTTAFAYTFKVFDEDDLTVILRTDATGTETVQAITTNYTVSGVGAAGGGNVTFVTAPASGVTVVIRRDAELTQTTDYTPNDPFPASEHENALDKLTFFAQQQQEELDRSIKLSRTNTMTSTEFTVGSSDRANKILGFDGTGELSVTQELGVFRGNWSSGTAFAVRDLVKDTTNNNIYICQVAHTSSGSLPISTNTDSSKWELIVDAATATSSATAAAASAAAAATSETNAAASESAAATSETNAAASEAGVAADAAAAAASATAAAASETAAAASETAAAASETAAAASETAAASSASSASTSASTATTKAAEASTSATNAATSETNAASSASAAATSAANASSSETNAATSASAASTSASNAATSETNAATSASNAATSESNASTSETNAAASATSASSSASTATTKAAEAATSASNAATSETNAATSETNAATSATNAASSATAAASSASSASSAQSAAESARDATLAAYDNFDDRYLGAKSSAPTLDNDGNALVAGALYFDTVAEAMYVYTGSSWVAAYVSGTGFLALTGGTMTGDINFGDNDKAIFGAGSDLQIYHDGSNSYIDDAGTGNLNIRSSRINFQKYTGETMAEFIADGATTLRYNNATKLATASTGVSIPAGQSYAIVSDADVAINRPTTNTLGIKTGNTQRMRVASNGDISFYADNGTTQGLFWDASAESLQLGGTTNIQAQGSNVTTLGNNFVLDSGYKYLTSGAANMLYFDATGNTIFFKASSGTAGNAVSFSETMRIDSSGKVGIGESAPEQKLHISGTFLLNNNQEIRFKDSGGSQRTAIAMSSNDLNIGTSAGGNLKFYNGSSYTERMRLDSSGNLLVGTTSTISSNTNGGLYVSNNGYTSLFNRESAAGDGNIMLFAKGGTTVGSIGNNGVNPYIERASNSGLEFQSYQIAPRRNGSLSNGSVSLGKSDGKFQDGWFSGTVNADALSIDSYSDPTNNYITLRPSFAPSASGGVGFAAKDHDGANNDGLGIYGHDGISFTTGGSERMRLDSSGNLLVGKTAAGYQNDGMEFNDSSNKLFLSNANAFCANLNRGGSDGSFIEFTKSGSTVGSLATNAGAFVVKGASTSQPVQLQTHDGNEDIEIDPDGFIKFETAGLEAARIDSSQNLLVGTSSPVTVLRASTTEEGIAFQPNGQFAMTAAETSAGVALGYFNRRSSDGEILQFRKDGSTVGNISITASGTTYNTTSDIRLKQDIEPLAATDKLMQMNPVSYAWKADPDGPRSMGFIAQEMQEVMPEAVSTGEDDDAMMSMDYGRITPILVSALQDAHRKIEQLEQRLADMEAN